MKAHDHALRLEVIECYEKGERQIDISRRLGLSYSTIKNWLKRYRALGRDGLRLRYDQCGGRSKFSSQLKQAAISLKREHPSWGGGYIRMKLAKQHPKEYIPCVRQLQRYFQRAGLVELRSKQPRAPSKDWARWPLYRVQVDAKEQIQTADGKWCCYLTFTDEYSGAVLEALVFPPPVYSPGSARSDL